MGLIFPKAMFGFDYNETSKKFGTIKRVMINPAQISIAIGAQKSETKAGTGSPKGVNQQEEEEPVEQTTRSSDVSLSMELHFDLVDRYEAAVKKGIAGTITSKANAVLSNFTTMDNILAAANASAAELGKDSFDSVSVLNPAMCCFPLLLEAAESAAPIYFRWGTIKAAGCISRFNVDYTCFTPYGVPIRAKVGLTLRSSKRIDKAADATAPKPQIPKSRQDLEGA